MALAKIKLPRLDAITALVDQRDVATITFAQWWDSVASQLEAGINGVIEAQNSADAAQASANTAQTTADGAQATGEAAQSTADTAVTNAAAAQSSADTAQTRADDAYALASDAVPKDAGPSWTAASGTPDRSGYSEYIDPTAAAAYDQTQMQDLMHATHEASQAIVALITDLRGNHSLTH